MEEQLGRTDFIDLGWVVQPMMKRTTIKGSDDLDILSAIWILACNDENPIITYEGVKYRLGLPSDYDLKTLVQNRGEMFRRGLTSRRLESWKEEMRSGKHLPSWIRDTEDDTERKAKVDGLTPDDLFRSQFRATADAPRSPIEIIDWGLQHIDRLRKANVEAREEKTKRVAGIWMPVLSMLVALTAILSGAYLQSRGISSQAELKKYEVSFKPKEDGYGLFMRSVIESYENAYKNNIDGLLASLDRTESAYYSLEPFLTEEERGNVWNQFQQFSFLCYQLRQEPLDSPKRDKFHDSFLWYKNWFRTHLYQSLFGQPAHAR